MTVMPKSCAASKKAHGCFAVLLVPLREGFSHGEVIGQLYDFEMMILSTDTFSNGDQIAKKQHIARRWWLDDSHSTSPCRNDEFSRLRLSLRGR